MSQSLERPRFILLCTATEMEYRSCSSALSGVHDQASFLVIKTGMGMENARRGLGRFLEQTNERPTLIISTGFAGSLDSNLSIGSWVHAKCVSHFGRKPLTLDSDMIEFLGGASDSTPVELTTVNEVVSTSTALGSDATINQAVDMESYAWAELARANGVPFGILRLISDDPMHPMPTSIQSWAKGARAHASSLMLTRPVETGRFISRMWQLSKSLSEGWRRFSQLRPEGTAHCEDHDDRVK